MALTVKTPYLTVEDADSYFATMRLNSTAWDRASTADKTKALTQATADIDNLRFKGVKTNSKQLLEFPRDGSRVIPNEILYACCEQAYCYLDGQDAEFEFDQLSRMTDGFSSVRVAYDSNKPRDHKQAGILSIVAWRYLKQFLVDPQSITFTRV